MLSGLITRAVGAGRLVLVLAVGQTGIESSSAGHAELWQGIQDETKGVEGVKMTRDASSMCAGVEKGWNGMDGLEWMDGWMDDVPRGGSCFGRNQISSLGTGLDQHIEAMHTGSEERRRAEG
jgi:hypothetical protein